MDNKFVSQHQVRYIQIIEDREGQRVDNFLLNFLSGVPKSRIYRMLRKGEVRVNKKRVKPEYRLQLGDEIRIPPVHLAKKNRQINPKGPAVTRLANVIAYEDDELILINKPSGLAVHGGSGLVYGLIELLRESKPKQRYLELVHRLDRETSGCLLVAKKRSVLRELHAQLRMGRIKKTYLTLAHGVSKRREFTIDAPLKRYELRSGERMVRVSQDGKASKTLFRVAQQFAQCTLFEAMPQTGRTHQIRVHATFSGHPIVGDEKYGTKDLAQIVANLGANRLFLHASRLQFDLDVNGKHYNLLCPLPTDLETVLGSL